MRAVVLRQLTLVSHKVKSIQKNKTDGWNHIIPDAEIPLPEGGVSMFRKYIAAGLLAAGMALAPHAASAQEFTFKLHQFLPLK